MEGSDRSTEAAAPLRSGGLTTWRQGGGDTGGGDTGTGGGDTGGGDSGGGDTGSGDPGGGDTGGGHRRGAQAVSGRRPACTPHGSRTSRAPPCVK